MTKPERQRWAEVGVGRNMGVGYTGGQLLCECVVPDTGTELLHIRAEFSYVPYGVNTIESAKSYRTSKPLMASFFSRGTKNT